MKRFPRLGSYVWYPGSIDSWRGPHFVRCVGMSVANRREVQIDSDSPEGIWWTDLENICNIKSAAIKAAKKARKK